MNLEAKYIRHILNKTFEPGTKTAIIELRKWLRKYFKIQKEIILKDLKSDMELSENIFKSLSEDEQNAQDDLKKILELITTKMTTKGAEMLLKNLNIDSSFWIEDFIALEYSKQHSWALITQIDKTTKKQINSIINTWLQEWADYTQLSKAISNRFKSFSKYRANVIAINEVAKAYEYWKITQAKEYSWRTWNNMVKKWITQWDWKVSSACKTCANDWWISVDKLFTWWFDTPPETHINCRCYCKYDVKNNL